MKKLIEKCEKLFYIFGLIYFTEPFLLFGELPTEGSATAGFSTAISGVPEIKDSTPLLLIRFGFLGITFLLTCIRYKHIGYLASRRKFLLAIVAWVLLSFLWSAVPDLTLRRGIVVLGLVLFGLNISARYNFREQLFLLAWAMGILALINFLFTVVSPSMGIESGEHAGAWRGLYPQKNPFARMMVMSALTFLIAALESHKHRYILWLGFGLSVTLILLSTSKTALVIFALLLLLFPLFRALRWNHSLALPFFIVILIIAGSIAIFLVGDAETIIKFLGRDITLTGRTTIWEFVISKIAKHPWLGYGYKGFWLGFEGDSGDIWYETNGFLAPNAHNGFLDWTVELGFIGLFFLLLTVGKNYMRAIIWLRLNPTAQGMFPIMYLTFILLYNVTESSLSDPPFILALYSAMTTTVLTQPIPLLKSDTQSVNSIVIRGTGSV